MELKLRGLGYLWEGVFFLKDHLDSFKAKLINLLRFMLIALCMIQTSACAKENNTKTLVVRNDNFSFYSQLAESIMPAFLVEQSDRSPYSLLDDGVIVEAFDTQAVGALEAGIARFWYPQALATVVIAVDRDQTNAEITGWQDLSLALDKVAFSSSSEEAHMILAAMSYGLEGEKYTTNKAIRLLAELNKTNYFEMHSMDAPVMICYDYQAVNLMTKGRNIDIIIPSEGTYTYEKGLLSNEKINFQGDVNQAVFANHLRPLNGLGDSAYYPSKTAYESSTRVSDYKYFASATKENHCLMERQVLNSNRLVSIDSWEHLLFALLYIIVVTIWAASFVRRSMQKGVSSAALYTGLILNGWVFIRLIKYQTEKALVNRYLWYSFYIFLLSLPLVILWMAWAVDKLPKETLPPKWLRYLALWSGLLVILVFTNDLHGLVFSLDLTRKDWAINYGYGVGYYLILLTGMLNLLAAFIILLRKSMKNPRKGSITFPLIVFISFAFYNYQYITRDPLFYQTDLTIMTGFFTLMMFEACIQSGLIPTNKKHIKIFEKSPLKMQIVNQAGGVVLASAAALPLEPPIIKKVITNSPVSIPGNDASIVFANPIPGGHAIWNEDVSQLYTLHNEIKDSTLKLSKANKLLAEEAKVKRAMNEADEKRKLMEQLEHEITESINQLTKMIENLSDSKNPPQDTTRIALLLGYLKRRCNLFFHEKESNLIDTNQIVQYLDELIEIANYSDVQIARVHKVKGNIDIRYGTLLYDFFYAVVDLAIQRECSYMIETLGYEEGALTLRLLSSEQLGHYTPKLELGHAIRAVNGEIKIKELEDGVGISLAFPKGGDLDD